MPYARLLPVLVLSLAAAAQDTRHPALDLNVDAQIQWIRDPEMPLDKQRFSFGLSATVDRTELLAQALTRAKEEKRPVLWYVPRIVEKKNLNGQQMYRAPVLDLYMQQVVFADPDVAGIIGERFVPLRMVCDETMSARFSLRPLDVIEPMVVFLDESGKVLHKVQRIRTFNAHWFADLMRRVLLAPLDGDAPAATDIDAAIRAGRWEQALATLDKKETKSARDWLTIATLHRRLRDGEKAHAALERIDASEKKLRPEIDAELGLLATLAGKPREAMPLLESAFRAAKNPRAAEAGYLLAYDALELGDETRALRMFEQLAERWPDEPYGRKAKANLVLGQDERPLGATFCGFESIAWLHASNYAGLPEDTMWRGGARDTKELAAGALQFLLDQQRDHGGFCDSRYAYWPSPDITPNVWIAVTAIAAAALLEWRDHDAPRIDAALRRAEDYLFAPHRLNRGKNEDAYADTYRLFYLAKKVKKGEPGERAAAIARMNEILVAVEQRQTQAGFWAHEYANAFTSGAMLQGVYAARDAGADVSARVIEHGTAALLSARFKNGAYAYGGSAPKEEAEEGPSTRPGRRRGVGSLKDAAARMPVCEGALLVAGKSDAEKVAFAFKCYWEYMDRMEKVRRNDFHSDGELAGFFFFHGLFHASETNKLLAEPLRSENRARFLAVLQKIPEMDGSFVDSHELGKSYGTAMALLTLRNCE